MPDWRQWETASQAEWGLAVERESVIRPLVEEDKFSAELLREAMLRLNIGRSCSTSLFSVIDACGSPKMHLELRPKFPDR